jgi:alpha-beta hydrolase superfamily lysophospholipase
VPTFVDVVFWVESIFLGVDLFESMLNRTYKKENDASERLYYELLHLTSCYKKVHVVGFSQGALITARTVQDLYNKTEIRKCI